MFLTAGQGPGWPQKASLSPRGAFGSSDAGLKPCVSWGEACPAPASLGVLWVSPESSASSRMRDFPQAAKQANPRVTPVDQSPSMVFLMSLSDFPTAQGCCLILRRSTPSGAVRDSLNIWGCWNGGATWSSAARWKRLLLNRRNFSECFPREARNMPAGSCNSPGCVGYTWATVVLLSCENCGPLKFRGQ